MARKWVDARALKAFLAGAYFAAALVMASLVTLGLIRSGGDVARARGRLGAFVVATTHNAGRD